MTTNANAAKPSGTRCRPIAIGLLLTAVVVVLLAGRSMGTDLDHDEHQFVAGGALLARQSLLPYRDYPYFHTPNLVFVYAAIFRYTDYLLLGARGVSVVCGAVAVVFTFFVVYGASESGSDRRRWLAATVAALLLLVNPLFLSANGLAWNHDMAESLLIIAAALFLRGIASGHGFGSLLSCGAFLGLAIGTRLTVAPAAAAFAGMVLADQRYRPGARVAQFAAFIAGLGVGLAPALWMLAIAPRGFRFGNFQYAALNTIWRHAGRHSRDTSPMGKLLEFGAVLVKPGNLLLIGVAAAGVLAVRLCGPYASHQNRRQLTFLGILILFLLVGSFAPSPLFPVYLYAPVPFVIWWTAYAIGSAGEKRAVAGARVAAVVMLACIVLGIPAYSHLGLLTRPSEWVPVRVHRTGEALRAEAGPGRVLTLAPIFPLEGGQDIYEAFATGPFAARVADSVNPRSRHSLRLVGSSEMDALLANQPPSAVLLSFEGELEWPLRRAGRKRGFPVVRLHGSSQHGFDVIPEPPSRRGGGD